MTPPSSPSALVGTTSMMLLPPCHCFSTPATLGGGGGRGKESSREQGGAGGGGRAVLAQEVLVEEDGACGGAAPLSGRARGRLAAEVQGRAPGGKLTVVIHRPPCVHDSRTAPSTRQSSDMSAPLQPMQRAAGWNVSVGCSVTAQSALPTASVAPFGLNAWVQMCARCGESS